MKSETEKYFAASKELLKNISTLLGLDLCEDAGRNCYLAGMNAARALIFANGYKINKRHKTLYGALSKALHHSGIHDLTLTAFLPNMMNLKAIVDYETDDNGITHERATAAIRSATIFGDTIEKIIAMPLSAPRNGKHKKDTTEP